MIEDNDIQEVQHRRRGDDTSSCRAGMCEVVVVRLDIQLFGIGLLDQEGAAEEVPRRMVCIRPHTSSTTAGPVSKKTLVAILRTWY
jgi:hypothetical protein